MKQVIKPFSLKNTPALIETLLPVQQLSAEAQKERKAGAAQTLTALGSYWKGRKPLILVRACVLGALLPATGDTEKDLAIFEKLMAMDMDGFQRRAAIKPRLILETLRLPDFADYFAIKTKSGGIVENLPENLDGLRIRWRQEPDETQRSELERRTLAELSYAQKLATCKRPEELDEAFLYAPVWNQVNAHLGTDAHSFPELAEQLGIMRFGRRPRVADTFCGGGSIPFEAARLGCDVYASDLNPIACMLTWGALNIIGANADTRARIAKAQQEVAEAVDKEITELGIEHDEQGCRAKAYLYCLETRCPESGFLVPMAPSWLISVTKKVYAKLVPNHAEKRFNIEIVSGASREEMQTAKNGTVQKGYLVYTLDGNTHRHAIKTLRGDYKKKDRSTGNKLRHWEKSDFKPRPDDIFQERLYCIQWTCSEYNPAKDKLETRTEFRGVTAADLERERQVEQIVADNLAAWQEAGLAPDMAIEPGRETTRLDRERGWTYWHHLFAPRQLLLLSKLKTHQQNIASGYIELSDTLNFMAKLCSIKAGGAGPRPETIWIGGVFINQALNAFYNYGVRAFSGYPKKRISKIIRDLSETPSEIICRSSKELTKKSDIFITDPPYANAIHYHEITEFFIAWLRKNPPEPFKEWVWDSRRELAIKGDGEGFRRDMAAAYKTMAEHMPDNGLQIIMFTHQGSGIWADMAGILWGAGLRVTAAWYIATETTSELKKGGYVQGTVLMAVRKRLDNKQIYQQELVEDIREEVSTQILSLTGLNQKAKQKHRLENPFNDADLQMAGYAAAMRVLTSYAIIDSTDMRKEALRPRGKGERSVIEQYIELAVQIANESLVPEGLSEGLWERLKNAERFYLKLLEMEARGEHKLDNYQNFAKVFKVLNYTALMGSVTPNKARLKSAADFKRTEFSGSEFAFSMLRAVLYALWELQKEREGENIISHLRDNVHDYYKRRNDIVAVCEYIAAKAGRIRPEEASAARILGGLVRNQPVGN
ncbi:MAG: DUF1156 domain-containing protein [Gammaproteobacteria bacterium]|nr:DUF1156 domain-containing protein [Gammaproteobacteria bacterium]